MDCTISFSSYVAHHPTFSEPVSNFFSIFLIFRNFLRVKNFKILYKLNKIVQYAHHHHPYPPAERLIDPIEALNIYYYFM